MKLILRKLLPLALALALLCALVPAALAEDEVTGITLPATLDLKVGDEKTLTARITVKAEEPAPTEPPEESQAPGETGGPGTRAAADVPSVTRTVSAGSEDIFDVSAVETRANGDGTYTATVTVTGKAVGSGTITFWSGGKDATCAVTVSKVTVENVTLSADPSLSFEMGEEITLTAGIDPKDAASRTVTWRIVEGVGNISLNGNSPTTTMITTEADAEGRSSITVTGIRAGTAKISATCEKTATCEITITAVEIPGTLRDGQMDLSTLIGTLDAYCRNITGTPLNYLTNISVSTSAGTLYENYVSEAVHGEGVSAAQRYYVSPTEMHQLSNVTFVPKLGYTGTVTITFTAYGRTSGDVFIGSIVVTIPGSSLIYTSENGEAVCFKASDFTNYSQTAGHNTINYVRFTLPDAKYGTLYYNYIDSDINEGPVSPSTSYKRVGAPYLDRVWFVPKPGFSGNVTIYFEYTDVSEHPYDGSLLVHVATAAGNDKGDISYNVRPGASVPFDVKDFSDLCSDMYAGSTLSYVTFTELPSSSRGTLYCGNYGAVTTSQSIYRAGTNRRLLSDVYFSAKAGYSGTVSIPFHAYTTDGKDFTGTVMITVSANADTNYATGSIITYSSRGEAVAFRSQDFFYDAAQHLSQPLSTVRFYTPEVSQGRLCLNYGSPTSYAILDTSVEYPYTTTSSIYFQPRSGFSGAAYVHFIAKDQSGKSYTGLLAVNVDPPTISSYFNDMSGHVWAISSVDFLARSNILIGTEYRTFSPSGLTKRGDFILMLQRCFNFSSGSNNPFADVPAGSYYASAIAGAYAIGLATGDGNGRFRPDAPLTRQEAAEFLYRCMKRSGSLQDGTAADLAAFSDRGQIAAYAVTAMATLVRLGVLTGDNYARMNPGQSLTRAEMAVMFHRALT